MQEFPAAVASRLKRLRALTASDQQHCSTARSDVERLSAALQDRSRQHRNLLHALEALEPLASSAPTICACPEPSVPPAQLRNFVGAYSALLTVLRRQPEVFATLLHRSGMAAQSAAQLLLSYVYGHLWYTLEEQLLLRAAVHALKLRAVDSGLGSLFDPSCLPSRVLSTYLRVMSGGEAWLQVAIGPTLNRLLLLLPREVGSTTGPGESEAAVRARCSDLLESLARSLPAAPPGLRRLAIAMQGVPRHLAVAAAAAAAAVRKLSVRELKQRLDAEGIAHSDAVERGELECRLLRRQAAAAGSAVAATVPPASTAVSACAATAKTSAAGATNVPVADGAHAGVELGEVAPPRLLARCLLELCLAPAVACPEAHGLVLTSPVSAAADAALRATASHLRVVAGAIAAPPPLAGSLDPLAQLALRCADRLLDAAGAGVDISPTEATDATCELGMNEALELSGGDADEIELPQREVEISLLHLRIVHTLCEQQRQLLVAACAPATGGSADASVSAELEALLPGAAATEPLVPQILDALVPAVYVLAEVGILWGDESISLEVGDAAIVDFARRVSAHEAAETEGGAPAGANETPAKAVEAAEKSPEVDELAPTTAAEADGAGQQEQAARGEGGAATSAACSSESALPPRVALAGRAARKLAHLLTRLPLHVVCVTEDSDAGRVWETLPDVLALAVADATVSANDSLLSQLRECTDALDELREIDSAEGTERGREAHWPVWLLEGLESVEGAMARKAAQHRDERQRLEQQSEAARTYDAELRGCGLRLRVAYRHAHLRAVISAAARAAAAGGELAQSSRLLREQLWYQTLTEREQAALLVALDTRADARGGARLLAATAMLSSEGFDEDDGEGAECSTGADGVGSSRSEVGAASSAVSGAAGDAAADGRQVPPQQAAVAAARPEGEAPPAVRSQDSLVAMRLQAEYDAEAGEGGVAADLLLAQRLQRELDIETSSQPRAPHDEQRGGAGQNGTHSRALLCMETLQVPPAVRQGLRATLAPSAVLLQLAIAAPDARQRAVFWTDLWQLQLGVAAGGAGPDAKPHLGAWAWLVQHCEREPLIASLAAIEVTANGPASGDAAAIGGGPMLAVTHCREALALLDRCRSGPAASARTVAGRRSEAFPSPSARQHVIWRGRLARVRRALCSLGAESRAAGIAAARYRSACVRLHTLEVATAVQTGAVHTLAHGRASSALGLVAAEMSDDAIGGDGSERHDGVHSEHDAVALVLDKLRREPKLLALAFRRSGLLLERCAVAVQDAAIQLTLCSLFGNRGGLRAPSEPQNPCFQASRLHVSAIAQRSPPTPLVQRTQRTKRASCAS